MHSSIKKIILYLVVTTVKFSQSLYSVDENSTAVQVVLTLDNTLSSDVTIQLVERQGTATGELSNEADAFCVTYVHTSIRKDCG